MSMINKNPGAYDSPESIRDLILGLNTLVPLDSGQMVPAINLDNAATTPPFKAVVDKVWEELLYYGSIGRGRGQKSEHCSALYTAGRDIVKDFVGANSEKYMVFYVNNTTDGMNKLASALIKSRDDLILATRMEHHANDLPWRERARTLHVEVDEKGRLRMDEFESILKAHQGRIKYVTVTAASNVMGYVNDVHAIAKMAHKHGAQIIVDGAQIVAHRKFSMLGDTPEEDIDFFVFSAHKMYAPFGGGAVVGLHKELQKHIPIFYGGGMVDRVSDEGVTYASPPDLYEAGSPNYPGVVGMLKAMELLSQIGFEYIEAHEQRLLKRVLNELRQIPDVILYGDNDNIADRVGIIVFNIKDVLNENVAGMLSEHRGIAVRHSAFCAHPYVSRFAPAPPQAAAETEFSCSPPYGMVRVSFGIYNTEEEADALLDFIRELVSNKPSAASCKDTTASNGAEMPNDRG